MNRKNVHRFEDPIIGDRGTCITSLSCSSMRAQWLSFVGATMQCSLWNEIPLNCQFCVVKPPYSI